MEPIDIVITWVDGEDPIHKAKRRKFLGNGRGETFAEVAAPTRFRSVGEIYFCIASILRFAPFVHHIYIVTDAQNPHADRFAARFFPESHIPITVVDHRTIFRDYEDLLPTFNSLSIETMLWRIPGLSERFVYFNDDVLLVAPVSPSDWYDEAGQPIIYGYWHCTWTARLVRWLRLPKHGHRTFTYKDSMLNAADVLGGEARKRFVRMIHASLPLQRSFFEQFYGQHPELLVENARWRFRNPHQFNPQSLFITYLALHNRCVLRPQGHRHLSGAAAGTYQKSSPVPAGRHCQSGRQNLLHQFAGHGSSRAAAGHCGLDRTAAGHRFSGLAGRTPA